MTGIPPPTWARTGTMRGYFVQGHIPYTGSKLLWQVNPQPGYKLGLRGKVGESAVKLCSFIDGRDITAFEARVDEELERLHEALHAFVPALSGYNAQIAQQLEWQVRTY